jgi:hypothetical protein
MTLARIPAPSTRRPRARPSIFVNWKTCVLPASPRMSSESSESALATMGTFSETSRTVKAMLVPVRSSLVTATSAARSARNCR